MSDIRLEIDTTKISLETLKRLYRRFEKIHRWQGGQGAWLLLIEQAIENHPEARKVERNPDNPTQER